MSLLFRILHSSARALADLFCAPPHPTIADGPSSTATVFLRLVPPPAGAPETCARCAARRMAMDRSRAATSTPPKPKTPPAAVKAVSVAQRAIAEVSPSSSPPELSGNVVFPPTPTVSGRRARPGPRSARPQLLYPPTPRLSATPPDLDIDLGLAFTELLSPTHIDQHPTAKLDVGLGLGLGLGLGGDFTGLGILPRAADPDAPSAHFLRELHDALVSPSSTIGSPPALSTGSMSPPETASPPSLAFSPSPIRPALAGADSLFGADGEGEGDDGDSDDENVFLSHPHPRPPTRTLKPRTQLNLNLNKLQPSNRDGSLSPSPIPRSPLSSPSFSPLAPPPSPSPSPSPSPLTHDLKQLHRGPKLRSSLSVLRRSASRASRASMRSGGGAFDQDTVASAARRVKDVSLSSGMGGECECGERPPWK